MAAGWKAGQSPTGQIETILLFMAITERQVNNAGVAHNPRSRRSEVRGRWVSVVYLVDRRHDASTPVGLQSEQPPPRRLQPPSVFQEFRPTDTLTD